MKIWKCLHGKITERSIVVFKKVDLNFFYKLLYWTLNLSLGSSNITNCGIEVLKKEMLTTFWGPCFGLRVTVWILYTIWECLHDNLTKYSNVVLEKKILNIFHTYSNVKLWTPLWAPVLVRGSRHNQFKTNVWGCLHSNFQKL